jgi:hypothetical protein
MVIRIDIDETICHSPDVPDYSTSVPIPENITKANKLYDEGNTIIYWTARGQKTGIDWSDTTMKQFAEWGVKYHEIHFDKPYFDLFIDDRNLNVNDWK